jgi:predicted SAM-dependent methyltransferase
MKTNIISRLGRKIESVVTGFQDWQRGGVAKPLYPDVRGSGLRIHLGAGPINIQGWINIDARDASHIHLQSSGFDLKEFSEGAVSEIYMCHVLEHFSFEEAKLVLKTMSGKLKVGGVLRLSVPDFDQLVAIYHANGNDLELIKMALMGGQDYEYNFHKAVFNKTLLSNLLMSCGFDSVQTWSTLGDFGIDLGDWSNKGFDTPTGNIPVSLNIKALKA